MRIVLVCCLSLFASSSIRAESLSLTIYGDNRALVEDQREIEFPKGRTRIELPNVSSQIIAPSATFSASDTEIIEQNFDFDLLSPGKMMEKAVGQTVRLVRTNPATGKQTTERVKVLSVNNGVVIQVDDRIEVLRDDGLPARVIFDRVPPNLRAKPTLSVQLESTKASTRKATLTYLTNGLSWQANYVALFNEKTRKMSLQGWSTLTNNTATTFENASTQLVAGIVGNANNNQYRRRPNQSANRRGGTEASEVERIGDNYLYPLPGRTTIASNQTKQVSFIDADQVSASKAYEYLANNFNTQSQPQNVDVRVVFSNSGKTGLGAPLPAGTVRVYARDSQDRAQFIGEDQIGHTAGGSEMSLKIGEAFDVTIQSTILSTTQINKKTKDTTMEYVLRNARKEKSTVTLRQTIYRWRQNIEIREESLTHRRPDANSFIWDVPVPAEGETRLRFTLRETRQ